MRLSFINSRRIRAWFMWHILCPLIASRIGLLATEGWSKVVTFGSLSSGPAFLTSQYGQATTLAGAAFDIPHFVMEQKMMRGIRDRAQQTRRDRTAAFNRQYVGGSTRSTHDLEVELNRA